MTPSDKLREFCENWRSDLIKHGGIPEMVSDLTALISEGYVEKDKAGYPREFIEWMIINNISGHDNLRKVMYTTNIITGHSWSYTLDELFNYWKENER